MGMREVRKSDLPPLNRAAQILWQTGHPGMASAIEELIEDHATCEADLPTGPPKPRLEKLFSEPSIFEETK